MISTNETLGHALGPIHKVNLGSSTGGPRRTFWGSAARCECGTKLRTNNAPPSRGGRKLVQVLHEAHLRSLEAS